MTSGYQLGRSGFADIREACLRTSMETFSPRIVDWIETDRLSVNGLTLSQRNISMIVLLETFSSKAVVGAS